MAQIVVERQVLRDLMAFAREFYADPENRRAFEQWEARRKKSKKPSRCSNTAKAQKKVSEF